MGKVVLVRKRRPREPGFHWPQGAEAEFLNDPHRRPLYAKPAQRVIRFASHRAAQADMEIRLAEANEMYGPIVKRVS